jgi:hypothetical protein
MELWVDKLIYTYMKVYTFTDYIKEDLDTNLSSRLSEINKGLKEDLLKMVEKSLNSSDAKTIEEFVSAYLRDSEKNQIEGLINDSDIYDFYIKYRNQIDEILANTDFFNNLQDFQKSSNSLGLYDLLVKGTVEAINILMKDIDKDLSSNESQQ